MHPPVFVLPPPPVFKPKHATPNGDNSTFLTSSYISNDAYTHPFMQASPSISPMTSYMTDATLPVEVGDETPKPKKRRRRSSAKDTPSDLEKKRKELKSQHSLIEKRRRIKLNREFETLKYIVPACRSNILEGLGEGDSFPNLETSHLMHKLTILQSTVEYIKYLHLTIKLMKLQMLVPPLTRPAFQDWLSKNDNLTFADYDLDLQSYRDIEQEFDFDDLFIKLAQTQKPSHQNDPLSLEIHRLTQKLIVPEVKRNKLTIEQENKLYRNNILQLQQDAESFKLPLPAIIDKYPTQTEQQNYVFSSKTSDPESESISEPLSRNPSISYMLN